MAFPCPVKTYHSDTYPAINPSLPHLSTKGKNVVVSGGGSGIGAAIVRSLATSGSTSITILGRREKNLLETKEAINKDIPDTTIYTIVADIASKESTLAAFDTIKSNVGTVDILIANAGYYSDHATIEGADLDEWFKAFEINVKGNFNLVKAFLPLATENAAVINVSAAMTHVEYFPLSSAYHSSKLAAIKIFDYIHNEHPELFVLNVHPGALRTAMAAKAISESKLPYDESEPHPNRFQ